MARKFGYHTNHHTLKRFLAPYETPLQLELDLTTFSSFGDGYEARWTVVRMAQEGWNKTSIADCLKVSRRHVYNILDAFDKDGFDGLKDHRTRPLHHPGNQLNLPFLKTLLDLQREYPRAGRAFASMASWSKSKKTPCRVSELLVEAWRSTASSTGRLALG